MAISETSLCNMSLVAIGAKRINNLETDTSVEAIHCRTHYEQTRDALLRSHWWRFASGRATLSQDTTNPVFEWDSQFILPNDFLRLRSIYDANNTVGNNTRQSFAIEGQRLLTNESAVQIRYVKKVTDVGSFDPLFVEVLVLQLALKLVMSLSQDKVLQQQLAKGLSLLMPRVRAMDRQETNTIRRNDLNTWVDARTG